MFSNELSETGEREKRALREKPVFLDPPPHGVLLPSLGERGDVQRMTFEWGPSKCVVGETQFTKSKYSFY